MKRFRQIPALLAPTLLAGAAIALAAPLMAQDTEQAAAETPSAPTKGELRLAKLIEGRTAGEPVSCITMTGSDNLQVIDGTALVYKRGKTVYVNIPADPKSLDSSDILVTYPTNANRLCRLDRVETRDRSNHFFTGTVMLSDFVPYTKQN